MYISLVHRMVNNSNLNKGIKVLLCEWFIEFKVEILSEIFYAVKLLYYCNLCCLIMC